METKATGQPDPVVTQVVKPDPLTRTAFTRELAELCRKHGVGIEGGCIWEMDLSWTGPDADIRAEYAVDVDGLLVRTF
jgi:hypothetical protein